ncbi:MAG: hypothetical protein ACO1NZ_10050 [Adhaeribacter sp.]
MGELLIAPTLVIQEETIWHSEWLFGICNPEPAKRGFVIRLSLGFRLAPAEGGLQIRSYILPDCKSGRAIRKVKKLRATDRGWLKNN